MCFYSSLFVARVGFSRFNELLRLFIPFFLLRSATPISLVNCGSEEARSCIAFSLGSSSRILQMKMFELSHFAALFSLAAFLCFLRVYAHFGHFCVLCVTSLAPHPPSLLSFDRCCSFFADLMASDDEDYPDPESAARTRRRSSAATPRVRLLYYATFFVLRTF